jgi:hypothetical protein
MLESETRCICSPHTPNIRIKSIEFYMTTPSASSSAVKVFGVLVDQAFLCHQTFSSSETVHEVIQGLWRTVNDKNPTPELPPPSIIQVALGMVGPFTFFKLLTCFSWLPDADLVNPAETTLSALTLKNPQVEYIVLFGMPSSWSFAGFPIGNKENVVAGMANLSITDDEGSKKLNQAGGSNKPNGE